jgi:hypothetical protein
LYDMCDCAILIHNPHCRLWNEGPQPAANDASQGHAKIRQWLPDFISWACAAAFRRGLHTVGSVESQRAPGKIETRSPYRYDITTDLPTITTRRPSLDWRQQTEHF